MAKVKRPARKVGKIKVDGQEMAVMKEAGGTGMTAIIRGNTKEEVWRIVSEMQGFAMENGLEQVEIMSIQPSPAGGWEAIVRAHNFNPLKWAKEKATAGWQATEGAREKVGEAGKKVAASAGSLTRRRMTPGQWEAAKAAYDADTTIVSKVAPDAPGYDQAVMAYAQGMKRRMGREREMMKYGIEETTKPRVTKIRVPRYDEKGVKIGEDELVHTAEGKTLTPEEIERKVKKAKQEAGPSLTRRAAGKVEEAITGASKYGTATAIGVGQAAGRSPMGVKAFQRGSQTFSPASGMTPFVAAPSPGAQQRLMASTVMPGVSPMSDGMRRFQPGAQGIPSVVGGLRTMPVGAQAPSPVGNVEPLPIGFGGRGERKTRVPSVLPGQQWAYTR